jgi:hypothetical protein
MKRTIDFVGAVVEPWPRLFLARHPFQPLSKFRPNAASFTVSGGN